MGMLKLLLTNLLRGPATEPYPFGEPTTPARYRGRIAFDPSRCTGCRICAYVCAGGAIHFAEDLGGLDLFLWHNACAFCGQCANACPTQALRQTDDWHLAHLDADKFLQVEHGRVAYQPCRRCGRPMLVAPDVLVERVFQGSNREIDRLQHTCRDCRQVAHLPGAHA